MPEKDGFDLLTELDTVSEVIFTTAYDQYAIKSFEYNALDYILKPVTAVRLNQALSKIQQRLSPGLFFRANRQQLINMNEIKQVDPLLNDGLELTLQNGAKISVSRRQAVEFKELFKL